MSDRRETNGRGGLRTALPWLGLAFAFSPVFADLVGSASSLPFGWSLLLPPVLFARALSSASPSRREGRPLGLVLVAAGLLLELLGVAGGSWSIARAGLPVAVVGMALWTGAPDPMAAALALWLVPIPTSILVIATPAPESEIARIAAGIANGLGGEVGISGPIVTIGARRLEIAAGQNGLHLAAVLAQLAWYSAVRERRPLRTALSRGAVAVLLALPLQILAVVE